MSPNSQAYKLLNQLYGYVLGRMRSYETLARSYRLRTLLLKAQVDPRSSLEALEPRLLLSTAPTVLSINRETHDGIHCFL